MNMKKAYLFALALLVSCSQIEAQEYAVEELLETASYYLNVVFAKHEVAPYSLNSVVQEKEIESISTISRDSVNYMYVFNTIDSTGWIILANEQQYESNVIGYSESGYFDVNGEMPPALLDLLEQHIHTIDSLREYPTYATVQQHSTALSSQQQTTQMLSGYRWNQSYNNDPSGTYDCSKVYNKSCPARWANKDKTCGKYWAGCGPVAMAQLMRYWKWPSSAKVSGTTYTYNWNAMPLSVTNSTPVAQVDNIATLLRNCGKASSTAYTGSGSSSVIGSINLAMQDEFQYHTERVHEYSGTNMIPILVADLDAKRPVICQAWNNDDELSAHTFLIDGYVKNTYQDGRVEYLWSINWGWGHSSSSYYNLNFDGYDGNRTFLTQIYPNKSKSAKAQKTASDNECVGVDSSIVKVEVYTLAGYLLSSAMNEDALNILTAGVYVVKRYWSNGNIEVNKIVKQ